MSLIKRKSEALQQHFIVREFYECDLIRNFAMFHSA